MALADVVYEAQEPSAQTYTPENFSYFDKRFDVLEKQCRAGLKKQGFTEKNIALEYYLHMRYDGTDCALMCKPLSSNKWLPWTFPSRGDFLQSFIEKYQSEFGFVINKRSVIVDDIRVRGVGKSDLDEEVTIPTSSDPEPKSQQSVQVFFETGFYETRVYLLKHLRANNRIEGPAIVMDDLSTVLIEPDCSAIITTFGDIKITIGSGKLQQIGTELDSIQLSIFSHRFMSIAEQMGR